MLASAACRLRAVASVCAALAAVLPSCSDERATVQLAFARDTDDYVRGFRCIDQDVDPAVPLWQRAPMEEFQVRMNLVVDFIALGGTPTCRSRQLRDWCDQHSCSVLPEYRRCFPFDVDMTPPTDFHEGLLAALDGLEGLAVTDDAPDEAVLVRVVATTASCDQVAERMDLSCSALVGCMASCPTLLDDKSGPLILDLDVGTTHCEADVEVCASAGYSAATTCQIP